MSISRCPHCGTANRAGANFCNGCGTDLREHDTRRPAQAAEPTAARDDAATETPRPRRKLRPAPKPATPALPSPTPPEEAHTESRVRLDFDPEEQPADAAAQVTQDATPAADARLIAGVQGLLSPIRVATNLGDEDPPRVMSPAPIPGMEPEAMRLLRAGLAETPTPAAYLPHPHARPPRSLRNLWLFALLALLIGVPALIRFEHYGAAPARLPGVVEAYAAIQALTPETPVIVYWAYDPATAGELDLAMQPVMRHLLQRRAQPAVLSPLPGGTATAQRLVARVRSEPRPADLVLAANLAQPVTYAYLPGGAAVLPLVARAPARVAAPAAPGLVVVAAAQAEDVQHWLEQVQPLLRTPVIAVTAAGADPILRPYRDSGQLVGLVSGFDGGYAYQQLLDPFAATDRQPAAARRLALQTWGQVALLAAILLGNLAALVSRDPDV